MSDQPDNTPADPDTGATPTPVRKDLMSDANYTKLQTDYDKLRDRYRRLKGEHEALKAEHASLETDFADIAKIAEAKADEIDAMVAEAVAEVTGERDRYKEMAESSPDQWKAKYEELLETNRVSKHQDAFKQAAKAAGVLEDALDDAWSLSGYKPGEGDPDDAVIQTTVKGLIETRPWLKAGIAADAAQANPDGSKAAPDGATPASSLAAKGKGPGMGRGASPAGSQANVLRATRAQLNDPAWKAANRDAIVEAYKAGTFEIDA